jgi:hypothetical protein
MFNRRVTVETLSAEGSSEPCPIHWIDSFAMRNFTNDTIFDDTLPVGDGLLEIGSRVSVEHLTIAMQDWFRRKGYLTPDVALRVNQITDAAPQVAQPAR